MKSFPPGSPQEERVELERVAGAIQAVNTCLPQTTPDSGTATATSGLLNSCSTLAGAFSVFVLQAQVAICWLWSQISAVLTRLDAIDLTLIDLQTQIDAIDTNMRTPGTVNITVGAAAGVGATASVAGNDTAGQVTINTGTGVAAGELFTLDFPTPYGTAGTMLVTPGNTLGAGWEITTTTTVDGTVAEWAQGPDSEVILYNYVILGGT